MPHGEFFEIGVAEALAQRDDLQDETLRAPGTTLNMLVHVAAAMAEEVEWQGAQADADGYLDTARGDALTRYVASEYGIARHGETSAVVLLTFNRTGTAPAEVPAGAIVSGDHLGELVRFSTDAPVEWGSGDTSNKTVSATAVQIGPTSNVPPSTIDTIETSVSDMTVGVSQSTWASGGNLAESDEDLVARLRDWGSRQVRGTEDAVRIGALEVEAVRGVSIAEVSTGGYTVIVSDASGLGNATLAETVRSALRAWRPVGVPFAVSYSQITPIDITVIASWDLGRGSSADIELLKSAIRGRVNRLSTRASIEPAQALLEAECLLTHAVITEVRPTVPGLRRLQVVTPMESVMVPPIGVAFRVGGLVIEGQT